MAQHLPAEKHPPVALRWRSNTFFITATVAMGLFTDVFLYSLVVPVLPFMLQDRIGVPKHQIQSHVSGLLAAYAASSVLVSPLAGLIADRTSTRQAPFLFGLAALLVSTLMFFLGTTIWMLVISRILQGVSAGFVWTIGLALCLDTVGPKNLGKTIGSIFSFISAGALCAPVLGGILYERAGYFSVCALALSIIAVDLVMRVVMIEKKVAARYNQTNGANQSNEDSAEEQPLLGNKNKGHHDDDDQDYSLPSEPQGVARLFPVIPCLRNPRLTTSLYIALIHAVIIGSFDATVTIVAEELFGFNSLKAGILLLPLGVADLVCGPIVGWCVDRYGTKPVALFSYIGFVPILVLLRLPHEGGLKQIILYGGLLLLCGVCFAGCGAPSIVEGGAIMERFYEANPDYFGENGPYAQLYGMTNMVFSLGLTVGPELAGEIKEAIGYGNMNAVLASISAITAVLCFLYIGPMPRIIRKDKRTLDAD